MDGGMILLCGRGRMNGAGKDDMKGGSLTEFRLYLERPFVAPDNTENGGKSQAGSVIAFCCKEGFETALAHLVGHSGAGVADVDGDITVGVSGPQGNDTALRHRIDRIKHQIH